MILYAYRVIIGLLEFEWFEAYEDRGTNDEEIYIKLRSRYNNKAPPKVRRKRHSSFFYKGPQLYNLLPVELRKHEGINNPDQTHVDSFKEKLDKYLVNIPDEPTVGGSPRRATTNSLICQIPLFRRKQQQLQK